MTRAESIEVGRYSLRTDVAYHRSTHLWVKTSADGKTARVGFDPLGHETSGDIVAVSFEPTGAALGEGAPFGTIEAAKFVGPLKSPVAGKIVRHNDAVMAHPASIAEGPFDRWLVEVELDGDPSGDLIREPEELRSWFEAEIQRFRDEGMIAE